MAIAPDTELLQTTGEEKELLLAAATLERPPYLLQRDDGKPDLRLKNAVTLVQQGRVSYDPLTTHYAVRGNSALYVVGETCNCPQGTKGPSKYCQHFIATVLYGLWHQRLGVAPPHQGTAPLPAQTAQDGPQAAQEAPMVSAPLPEGSEEPGGQSEGSGEALEAPIPGESQEASSALDRGGEVLHVVRSQEKETRQRLDNLQEQLTILMNLGRLQQARTDAKTLPPIATILANLARPLPDECLSILPKEGQKIKYVHWWVLTRLLSHYAPGWQEELLRVDDINGTCRVAVKIGIPCAEGMVWRVGIGEVDDWETAPKQYGNPPSNAHANARKRAVAAFGFDQLYDADGTGKAVTAYLNNERVAKTALLKQLWSALEAKGLDRDAYVTTLKQHCGVEHGVDLPDALLRSAIALVESQESIAP